MAVQVQRRTIVDAVLPESVSRLWDVGLIVAFSCLMALLSRISIPLPWTPVPVTGQTFGVLLTGALLGSRRGFASLLVYLSEGLIGLPVFAFGLSGWAVLTGPTGGYLFGFPLAALLVGWLAKRGWDRSVPLTACAMVVGNVVIYAFGLAWLAHYVGVRFVIADGLQPFLWGDALKIALAAILLPSAWTMLRRSSRPR